MKKVVNVFTVIWSLGSSHVLWRENLLSNPAASPLFVELPVTLSCCEQRSFEQVIKTQTWKERGVLGGNSPSCCQPFPRKTWRYWNVYGETRGQSHRVLTQEVKWKSAEFYLIDGTLMVWLRLLWMGQNKGWAQWGTSRV